MTGTVTSSIPPTSAGQPTVVQCIEAHAAGELPIEALLSAVQIRLQTAPDDAWEVLSVADQFFRRGKISSDSYQRIKSCVGAGRRIAGLAPDGDEPVEEVPAVDAVAPRSSLPSSGDLLRGRYRLGEVVGSGPSATIFSARDTYLIGVDSAGQRIAVKMFSAEWARQPDALRGLLKAFESLRSLSHPNILRLHDFDRDGDQVFFTMELLVGATLSEALVANPGEICNPTYARQLIQSIGAGVAYAHSRGVVHGNIHPDNLVVDDLGGVRLLGFGGSPPGSAETTSYASREVLEGKVADERDDLFALAAIAYRLLAGRPTYGGSGALQAYTEGLSLEAPEKVTRSEWAALRAGLTLDRSRRPSDVAAWLRELAHEETTSNPTPQPEPAVPQSRSRQIAWVGAMVAVVLLIAVGGWQLVSRTALRDRTPSGAGAEILTTPEQPAVAQATTVPDQSAPQVDVPLGTATAATAPPPPTAAETPVVAAVTAVTPVTAVAPATAVAPPPLNEERSPAAPAVRPGLIWASNVRIEFQSSAVDVASNDAYARVIVKRRGNPRGKASFSWWTESGTAKPGTDFEAVTTRSETIEDGKTTVSLLIPVILGAHAVDPRSFYVVIDEPSPGALLGPKSVAIVTLTPPTSP